MVSAVSGLEGVQQVVDQPQLLDKFFKLLFAEMLLRMYLGRFQGLAFSRKNTRVPTCCVIST